MAAALATVLSAAPAMAACGDGVVDLGEDCDLSGDNGSATACCTDDCLFRGAGETCRPSAGDCDVDDACTGADAQCPVVPGRNLALDGTATQISDLASDTQADLGIDGNTSGQFIDGSITHTGGGPTAERWWQLDLGNVEDILEVRIWNRLDCCSDRLSNFHLLVSDDPFASDVLADNLAQAGVDSWFQAGAAPELTTLEVDRSGRYLRVYIANGQELSLAEVEVMQRSDGKVAAGSTCRAKAGECDIEETCDGEGNDCPGDQLEGAGHTCRERVTDCDEEETCDGVGAACPADAFVAAGEECGFDDTTVCARPGQCPGTGPDCVRPDTDGVSCQLSDSEVCTTGTCTSDDGSAFVGFTASNGAAVSAYEVLSWSFQPTGAPSPTLDFPDFSSIEGLNLVRFAAQDGAVLNLCEELTFCWGAAWGVEPQPVTSGFDTSFEVRISTDEGSTVSDGMAFVVHRDFRGADASGGNGDAIGYAGGMSNGIAIELDTFDNGETDIPHVSVQTSGRATMSSHPSRSIGQVAFPGVDDGEVHTVRVTYTPGDPGELSVFLDGAVTADLVVDLDLDILDLALPVCEGPFGEAPRQGCLDAGASSLSLKKGAKASLKAGWKELPALTQGQLSDPVDAGTEYAVCIHDDDGLVMDARIRDGGLCGPKGKPCWKATKTGYLFKDPAAEDDGVQSLLVSGGAEGKSKASVKGTGADLGLAVEPLSGPVSAQVVQLDTGLCLGTTFTGAEISDNEAAKFKAKKK